MTHRDGYRFIDIEKGRFARTDRKALKSFFDQLRQDGTQGLVVHFHGGLVSREAAHQSAARFGRAYAAEGVQSLFFVWNTDLGTMLRKNLPAIASEAVFWTIVSRVRSLVLWAATDIPTAVAGERRGGVPRPPRFPPNETATSVRKKGSEPDPDFEPRDLTPMEEAVAYEALESDGSIQRRFAELAPRSGRRARGAGSATHKRTLMSPEVLSEAFPRSTRGARALVFAPFLIKRVISAARRVLTRYVKRTHHGLYATIVEEVLRAFYAANVGRAVWNAMKNDSVAAFEGSARARPGSAFVEELLRWWTPEKTVTLVGHSAGSIFIVELLQRLAAASTRVKANCVLLAPACTFERFRLGLAAARRCLAAVRVFNLSDERERGYWEVRYLYNASLLYLVSGILEQHADEPLIGMQRYFSGRKPYAQPKMAAVREFLQPALNWAPATAPPARLCDAMRHGGFDLDAQTLRSLASIVKDGIA
jgi:hypothetical protein